MELWQNVQVLANCLDQDRVAYTGLSDHPSEKNFYLTCGQNIPSSRGTANLVCASCSRPCDPIHSWRDFLWTLSTSQTHSNSPRLVSKLTIVNQYCMRPWRPKPRRPYPLTLRPLSSDLRRAIWRPCSVTAHVLMNCFRLLFRSGAFLSYTGVQQGWFW